jgi:ethanolamine utilization protein EutN
MQLAIVVGQVVSTARSESLGKDRLLLVEFVDAFGAPSGVCHVAADGVGAGNGEWVLVVAGSSARRCGDGDPPIDLGVIGIVDQVVVRDEVTYRK